MRGKYYENQREKDHERAENPPCGFLSSPIKTYDEPELRLPG